MREWGSLAFIVGCAVAGCDGKHEMVEMAARDAGWVDDGGDGDPAEPLPTGPPPFAGAGAPPGPLQAVCGDAMIDSASGEQCDDGNRDPGDGCTAMCRAEPGYTCSPSGCVFPRSQIDGTQELRNISENTHQGLCSYIDARLLDPRFERDRGAFAPFDLRQSVCGIVDPAGWLACSTPVSTLEDCIVEVGTADPEADGYAIAAVLVERCSSARLCACAPGTQACFAPGSAFSLTYAPEGRYFGRCSDEGVYVPEQSVDCDAERSICRNDMGCVHDVIYGEGIEWRPITGAGGAYDLYYMTADQVLTSFTIGLQGAGQDVVDMVVWEASEETGPFTAIHRESEALPFDAELVVVQPNVTLSRGKYYAVGLQWGADVSLSYAASPVVRHAFPFGYWLRSLEGSEPATATANAGLRLRAAFAMHDVVDGAFSCDAIRGRCATSELDDALELRALSATQWQAFCERLPNVSADSVGRLCDDGLFAALGDTAVARCNAYQSLDWSTCALTVGEATQCWTSAADICTDYTQCMPDAWPVVPRLQ
jgi:cysteine-rich repeat protein